MTRARDLLVLARSSRKLSGEWLDCIEAPWLLPNDECDIVSLPSGECIAAQRWTLKPVESAATAEHAPLKNLYWFQSKDATASRLPLNFNPSSAGGILTTVLEKCRIGKRIPVSRDADMSVLGTAIHACICLSFTDRHAPLSEIEVENILNSFDVSAHLAPVDVLRQVSALHEWITGRWPDARPHAEIAVQSILPSGQVLNGRIDLLLETNAGWILIDHKSSQLASDNWDKLATEYGAQMAAYGKAVEKASGRKIVENWLSLPVAGGALRIDFS